MRKKLGDELPLVTRVGQSTTILCLSSPNTLSVFQIFCLFLNPSKIFELSTVYVRFSQYVFKRNSIYKIKILLLILMILIK